MRHTLRSSLALIALLLPLLATPVSAAPPASPGNSAAAKACQDGGYARYVGPDGQPFRSPGECVQFVAQGGTLRPPAPALTLTLARASPRHVDFTVTGHTIGATLCFQQVDEDGSVRFGGDEPYCYHETTESPLTGSFPAPCQGVTYTVVRNVDTGQEIKQLNPPCS